MALCCFFLFFAFVISWFWSHKCSNKPTYIQRSFLLEIFTNNKAFSYPKISSKLLDFLQLSIWLLRISSNTDNASMP